MTVTPNMENNETLPEPEIKKIDGVGEYELAVGKLLSLAQRQIRIFDKTISPEFNSVARYEILRRFLFADRNNRLEIIVHDTSNLGMLCPRLVMLLKQFS